MNILIKIEKVSQLLWNLLIISGFISILFQILSPKLQYTIQYKDALFGDPPYWLQSFIYAETFFQLPFFFFAAYAFYKGLIKIMYSGTSL